MERNAALERLDVLVGEWRFEASVDGEITASGRARFEWMPERTFLVQHAEADPPRAGAPRAWVANLPFPVFTVMGFDDSSGEFTMLYADARGVCRVYRMTLHGRTWTIQGQAGPDFFQRFAGTFGDDGRTIESHWDRSTDGSSWERDFDMQYSKLG
jgi:hypothetical protein